jgi:membrane protein
VTIPEPSTAIPPESFWKLGGLSPEQLLHNVIEEISANNLFGRAAELAFYFLFALFPLILVMMTVFGLFESHRVELQNNLLSYFADFLPPTAFRLLKTVAMESATNASGGKLTFGIVSALWCGSGGVCSMISALNSAYHVRESRSWLKVRSIALGLTLLISILLLAALFFVLVGRYFVGWFGTEHRLHPIIVFVWKAIQWPAAILFVTMSCSAIYYCGPDLKNRHWHWMTPGSALGAFVWITASLGFRMYLHFVNNYSATYGSLGAVMILLLWLYVSGLAYLLGGTINAQIQLAAWRGPSPILPFLPSQIRQ